MQADVFCSYADAMRGKVTLRMFSDKWNKQFYVMYLKEIQQIDWIM